MPDKLNPAELNMDTKVTEDGNVEKEDKLAKAIGENGRWQICVVIFLGLTVKSSLTWVVMNIIFLAPKTDFLCIEFDDLNTNVTVANNTCYSSCVKYEYYSEFDNTIISEWDLICEKAWLTSFAQTLTMFGILVGSTMFGFAADRWGRRPTFLTASTCHVIVSFITPFSPNLWMFIVLRFVIGITSAGLMVVGFVYIMEMVGPSKRAFMACIYQLPIALGEMVMPAFAYYLRDWNTFSIGTAMLSLTFLSFFFIIPETPKWLISMNRFEEASEVMANIAKWNKLRTENMISIAKEIAAESEPQNTDNKSKASYIDLVTARSLRIKVLSCCLLWFIMGLAYYGGNQYIGQTSSNTFITVALAGALQFPGIFASGYCCKRFGRRNTMFASFICCSICNAALASPDDWFYFKLVAGASAVMFSSIGFSAIYISTSELFPTVVRNMALGASSTSSRVGSMVAPFVAALSGEASWAPPAVFAATPLVGAAISLCLPETRGRRMPDHINDNKT